MNQFTHRELDGRWNRLLGCAILESRSPNDGQSSNPRDKTRHQYTLVNGIFLARNLPPVDIGDKWRGERRPPQFVSIDWHVDWPLLIAWQAHCQGDLPHPWSTGGMLAYGDRIAADPVRPPAIFTGTWQQCLAYLQEHDPDRHRLGMRCPADKRWEIYEFADRSKPTDAPVSMLWMRSRIEITGTGWPQQIPCPHCQDWIVWAEAGYVPGRRICRGCHRHWQITQDSGSDRGWMLTRCNYPRIWPYGGAT